MKYKCPYCGRILFKRDGKLYWCRKDDIKFEISTNHMGRLEDDMKYKCPYCGRILFKRDGKLYWCRKDDIKFEISTNHMGRLIVEQTTA